MDGHVYEIGDEVKIWVVFKNPVGTVRERANPGEYPAKYVVQYRYEDGSYFTETFDAEDLTLIKRHALSFKIGCECGSNGTGHSHWCPRSRS